MTGAQLASRAVVPNLSVARVARHLREAQAEVAGTSDFARAGPTWVFDVGVVVVVQELHCLVWVPMCSSSYRVRCGGVHVGTFDPDLDSYGLGPGKMLVRMSSTGSSVPGYRSPHRASRRHTRGLARFEVWFGGLVVQALQVGPRITSPTNDRQCVVDFFCVATLAGRQFAGTIVSEKRDDNGTKIAYDVELFIGGCSCCVRQAQLIS